MTGTYPAEVFFIALLYGWAPILTSTLALHYNNLHSKKTFYNIKTRSQIYKTVFIMIFITFAITTGAYPSGAPFKCSTLWVGYDLN